MDNKAAFFEVCVIAGAVSPVHRHCLCTGDYLGFAVGDLRSLSSARSMGNACASTTQQGPTASTAPRSITTSLGRLPMAKPEPPKSVGVSSQLGIVSPEPLLGQNTSSFCLSPVFPRGSRYWIGEHVLAKELSEWRASATLLPSAHGMKGGNGPVCRAPHLEILMRPCCLLFCPLCGIPVHLLEIWSSAAGRLEPAGVPWRCQGASIAPSMGTADKTHLRCGHLLLDMDSAHPLGSGGRGNHGLWGGLRVTPVVLGGDAQDERKLQGTAEVMG